ncbi:MAG: HEAT repeat domain-containing protein [Polyangiaceae bacterium]|nr:HEAT repeat domain-containing protein [Polyangiaceae bacterium]
MSQNSEQTPKKARPAKKAKRRKRSAPWIGPALIVLGLLPAMSVALRAAAEEGDDEESASAPADESPWQARKRVLAAMATDASVLINVTDREMPASPDILNLGKRGTKALERGLSDNVDAGIRRTCAIVLGTLGDRAALKTLQAALDDWEPAVRHEVITALGKIPDKSSFEPLLALYKRKDEETYNRIRILQTLGALSHPKAVSVIRDELRKTDPTDLRPAALLALWMSRHLVARETLIGDVASALRSGSDSLILPAAEASAELRSPRLVQPLIPLMEHPNPGIRNKAVYALGLIGDKTAAKALLARLPSVRDARMLNNIAFALERLDRGAFYSSIRQVIEHKQAIIRLNAAFVLGDVKRPEGLDFLTKALDDPSDYVKTSAVVALGKIGTQAAIKPLERFVDSPNLSIRQEAIYAIHTLSGGKRADLIYTKLYQTKSAPIRHRAAIELGKVGDTRVRNHLLACVEQGSCALDEVEGYLRADKDPSVGGRLLLAWARGRDELTDLLADLRPNGTLPLAASHVDAALARSDTYMAMNAIDLVGDMGDPAMRGNLSGKLRDTDTWLRIHAAVAMSRLGDKDADAAVLRELDNLPAEWLPPFAKVVSRIDEAEVRARLSPELMKRETSPDPNVALAAAAVRLAWDPEAAFFRFLDALAAPSGQERFLAERYIRRNEAQKVTWLLRRALSRETRDDTRDRLRNLLVGRSES